MTEREELREKLYCARDLADRVYEWDIPMYEKTAYFDKVNELDRQLRALSSASMEQEG